MSPVFSSVAALFSSDCRLFSSASTLLQLKSCQRGRALVGVLIFIVVLPILILLLGIGLQDFIIFPEVWKSKIIHTRDTTAALPAGYQSVTLETRDREKLEVAKYEPHPDSKITSIFFHGSNGTVRQFTDMQSWLGDLGTNALQVDYRGYGNSTGWPSETGIFIDAETMWEYAVKNEKAAPERTIIFGYSLGAGPATYLASRIKPALLVLIAPFTSIQDVMRASPYWMVLTPFIRPHFANETYLKQLTGTNVIIIHGAADKKVSVEQSRTLAQDLDGYRFARYIEDPDADHNDIFTRNREKLAQEPALRRLLDRNE